MRDWRRPNKPLNTAENLEFCAPSADIKRAKSRQPPAPRVMRLSEGFISLLDADALELLEQDTERTLREIRAELSYRHAKRKAAASAEAHINEVRRRALARDPDLPAETIRHYQAQLLRDKRRERKAKRNQEMVTLFNAGYTLQRIADMYQVHHSTVWRVIHRQQSRQKK